MNAFPKDNTFRQLLSAAQRVYLCGGTAFPEHLVKEMFRDPQLLAGKEVVCGYLPGFSHTLPEVQQGTAGRGSLQVFFAPKELTGRPDLRFVPMQYRRLHDHIAEQRFDLCLARVARDSNGTVRFGMGVDFQLAAFAASAAVALEVHEGAPFVHDAPDVPLDRVAAELLVDASAEQSGDTTAEPAPVNMPDTVTMAIARNVASLVQDGDCLQTGIGAIPDAVLDALADKSDLGCHSGMIGDGVARLAASGALTGAAKSIDRHRIVTGFVLGGQALRRWACGKSDVSLRPVKYTHDARVLAAIDNLVCINSAIEVDRSGQVNAEMIGGRQVSGTGGSVDFARGAALSRNGRSIIALPATARGGESSRIVPQFQRGARATLLRTDVDFVVTEYGVARLSGCSDRERRRNLADVAAPEFRSRIVE